MKNLAFLFLAGLLFACAGEPIFNEDQLVGNWEVVSWTDETNNQIYEADVTFSFDEDGRYVATNGGTEEKGKYWIAADNLHTVEDGKAEKKVKIEKLSTDSLVFGMNRVGAIEKMVLVKR